MINLIFYGDQSVSWEAWSVMVLVGRVLHWSFIDSSLSPVKKM